MNTSTEKDLTTATTHWLENMKMAGYEKIFNESLLIIPIAKYFRGQGFEVEGDTDCNYLLSSENIPMGKAQVNYDFYAKKDKGDAPEAIILEMKWMKEATQKKKGSGNYSRIITDFVKLAIPPARIRWKRLAVVALDAGLPQKKPNWLMDLMGGKQLPLKIERNDDDNSVTLNANIPSSEANTPSHYEPFSFNDQYEKGSIFKKLKAYGIAKLELMVKPAPLKVSNGSVSVMVFSVERKPEDGK